MKEDKKAKTERLLNAVTTIKETYQESEIEIVTFEDGKSAVYATTEAFELLANLLREGE
jgi:hypothetical protein